VLDGGAWTEPSTEWCAPLDEAALTGRLANEGELLTTWPAAPFETAPTDCFKLGQDYWITQAGVGAIRFSEREPRLSAFPFPGNNPPWFQQVVTRSWLPAIYPFWGRQVIHASAARLTGTQDAVAFTGPTQAGKSTIAYGLGQYRGWGQLTDDTLAFTSSAVDGIRVYPLRNEARLRPATAAYFGRSGEAFESVEWSDGPFALRAIYVLDGDERLDGVAEFSRLRAGEGLPLLLQQAYALSFEIARYNQLLMTDYAHLAASVPVFRLRYRRSFDVAAELFHAIDRHAETTVGLRIHAGRPGPE
jgi:hypothetical protein